jgi:mannose-1-phosphate guanylyltransferase
MTMSILLDPPDRERWGLVLAGGQGLRLRRLTRVLAGDERPKQFCQLLGNETLLERARRRAALEIPPARIVVSLMRGHERFYRPLLGGMPAHCAVVQPQDRGTAPAILYGVMRIARLAPMSMVAVFPSDHYVSDDHRFMQHVAAAFRALEARPDLVVLLGIAPETAESEYGWIEPAESISGTPLFRVRRFWEKPAEDLAHALLDRGCLWNSFVMVASVPTLIALVRQAAPALHDAFATVEAALGTPAERSEVQRLYGRLEPSNFSEVVLASRPANLAVLPVSGVRWSDWGQPERVVAVLRSLDLRPEWIDRLATTA